MVSKLSIDLSQGLVEVDGDEDLVREVYRDFKERLLAHKAQPAPNKAPKSADSKSSVSPKRRKRTGKAKASGATDGGVPKVSAFKPSFDSDLDLKALPAFYDKFEPKNHSEKILIFAVFMRDELDKAPCTANDLYSCYWKLKDRTKIPKAFVQTIRDAESPRYGFVRFESVDQIEITTAGNNHFSHDLKKAGD